MRWLPLVAGDFAVGLLTRSGAPHRARALAMPGACLSPFMRARDFPDVFSGSRFGSKGPRHGGNALDPAKRRRGWPKPAPLQLSRVLRLVYSQPAGSVQPLPLSPSACVKAAEMSSDAMILGVLYMRLRSVCDSCRSWSRRLIAPRRPHLDMPVLTHLDPRRAPPPGQKGSMQKGARAPFCVSRAARPGLLSTLAGREEARASGLSERRREHYRRIQRCDDLGSGVHPCSPCLSLERLIAPTRTPKRAHVYVVRCPRRGSLERNGLYKKQEPAVRWALVRSQL